MKKSKPLLFTKDEKDIHDFITERIKQLNKKRINVPKGFSDEPKQKKPQTEGKTIITLAIILSTAAVVIVAIPYGKILETSIPMLCGFFLHGAYRLITADCI